MDTWDIPNNVGCVHWVRSRGPEQTFSQEKKKKKDNRTFIKKMKEHKGVAKSTKIKVLPVQKHQSQTM